MLRFVNAFATQSEKIPEVAMPINPPTMNAKFTKPTLPGLKLCGGPEKTGDWVKFMTRSRLAAPPTTITAQNTIGKERT